jgi:hypothetical protein
VERLRAIPDSPDDYIDIRGISKNINDIMTLKKKLWYFLREKSYIEACNSCNGRTYGDPEITPGIQTKSVIQYLKFERSGA